MLFDRLVFPVPANPRVPKNGGLPHEAGPVEWVPNDAEWKRWKEKGWYPEGQAQVLEWLEPVTRKVFWDAKLQEQWRIHAKELAEQHGVKDQFVATRSFLTRDLPDDVKGVVAAGPAYRTYAQVLANLKIKHTGGQTPPLGTALATVLGWEFLAPKDDGLSDKELLTRTVKFVTDETKDFKSCRRAFIDWQQKFLSKSLTKETIETALKEMQGLLDAEKKAADKLELKKIPRYAFRIAPAMVGLIAAIAGISGNIHVAELITAISLGGIAVDEAFSKSAVQGQPAPTAFLHQANRHFGEL